MKRTKRIQKLVMLIPLLLIVCFVIFPYIWTFLTSIKPTDELYTTNIKILPRETTFQNYVTLFTSTDFLASMPSAVTPMPTWGRNCARTTPRFCRASSTREAATATSRLFSSADRK